MSEANTSMSTRHLNTDEVKRLEGGDAAARAYFAEHLAEECEACETFLAAHDGPGLLDGLADAALLREAERAATADATLDEVGFQRIKRAMRGASGAEGPAASSSVSTSAAEAPARTRREAPAHARRRIVYGFASAAAVALVAVGVWRASDVSLTRGSDPDDGIKSVGIAPALTLELQAAHQPGRGEVQRVDPGSRLPASGELMLRYYATDSGSAVLFRRTAGGLSALGTFSLEPGANALLLPTGEVAALPLEGEAGELTLYLVGKRGAALQVDEARRAVEDPRHSPLAVARVTVRIDPSLR